MVTIVIYEAIAIKTKCWINANKDLLSKLKKAVVRFFKFNWNCTELKTKILGSLS